MGHLLGAVSAIGLLLLVLISLGRVGRILRLPYEHWLFLHRLTGLLLLSALLHCWFLDLIIDGSTPLLAIYVTMATIDLTLTPTGETTLPVTGGQFVYLRVGGWHEHPFSGGPRQVWIAGGHRYRALPRLAHPPRRSATPHRPLLLRPHRRRRAVPRGTHRCEAHRPELWLHPTFSRSHGRLTAERIQAEAGPITPDTHVFLCGPASMIENLTRALHRQDVPRQHLHAEHFAFR
ncbi:hypothetical protein [Streptomyces niveus]|uniref:hypothetical protein n=1 Tax=Streptomyces niveus TaxID=193462 RepID=UPI0034230CD7